MVAERRLARGLEHDLPIRQCLKSPGKEYFHLVMGVGQDVSINTCEGRYHGFGMFLRMLNNKPDTRSWLSQRNLNAIVYNLGNYSGSRYRLGGVGYLPGPPSAISRRSFRKECPSKRRLFSFRYLSKLWRQRNGVPPSSALCLLSSSLQPLEGLQALPSAE